MNVNEPDSLVCWSDSTTVRVSPLATADSVEFGTTQAATNAAATASCAAAPPRPAPKPEDCAFPYRTHTLWPGSLPPAPTRPAERASRGAPYSDPRIVRNTSQLGKKRFAPTIARSRDPFNLDLPERVCLRPSGSPRRCPAAPAAHRIRQ